ncbi:MAG: ATP-dependent metallopeptidase FtsH/Yme1/Tma family protein, partial [Candidatus Puniceispirillaceae bacterium]
MNNFGRNIAIWLIIGAALLALFNMFQSGSEPQNTTKMAYSDFIAQARSGGITEVLIEGNNLKGRTRENSIVTSYRPEGADVMSVLEGTDVRIDARPDESNMPGLFSVLISWFPMLLFIGVWIFFMRQMQGGGKGGAMGFGKSRAKM